MLWSKKSLLFAASIVVWLGVIASLGCNNPPVAPSEPDPADGATVSGSSVTLCWCGGDPDPELPYYDVYFGEVNPPPVRELNIQEKSYHICGLEPNKTYYWMIVAQDLKGDTCCSEVWSFSTRCDQCEPNNWFDEAYGPLDFNIPYQLYISDRHDVDFFYITPPVNGTATIELTNLPADYDLYLCDASENLIRFSENGKLENERVIHYLTGWDKYFIIVRPCEACDPDDPYTLTVNFVESPTDTYEPNDWFNTAYGPLDFGEEYESYIWDWDDEYDFYYFIPDTSGSVKIQMYSLPGDYDLALYDENQEELDYSANSGTSDEVIRYYVNGGEIYYAIVIPDDLPDSTDSYLLSIEYDTTQSGDSYEPNDNFADAYGPLTIGNVYESWIWYYDDVDYYYLIPEFEGTIEVTLYSIPVGTDYDLYVYDEWQDLIGASENGSNDSEYITFYSYSYSTYYILVFPYEGYDTEDSYMLETYLYQSASIGNESSTAIIPFKKKVK